MGGSEEVRAKFSRLNDKIEKIGSVVNAYESILSNIGKLVKESQMDIKLINDLNGSEGVDRASQKLEEVLIRLSTNMKQIDESVSSTIKQ